MTQLTRWLVLAALFLIPLLPLYVASSQFFPFITGKGFAFRILVEVAFVGWVALAAMDRRYRPQFSWLLALFGAFTTWIFIADLLAINAHKALWSNFERMDGFVTLIHVFLFFMVAGVMLAVDRLWRKWWLTFLTVAGIVCAYSVLQLAGGLQINQGGVRVDASFGNAIYLAVYLMFAAFIAVWQGIQSKGWMRHTLFALAGVSVIILFNTATRGAIVAVTAGAGLAALLALLNAGKGGRKIAVGALAGLLLLVGGFYLVKDVPMVREHPIWGRVASISLSELTVRFTLWSMAGEGIKERPLFGYGQEGYNYVFNEYYRPEMITQEPWFDRAHSAYVDWLVAGGVPALLLFLALLAAAFVSIWRAPNMQASERILLTSMLAAYALQAIVVFDNLFSYVPLAALLAYVHGRVARKIPALERAPELSRGYSEAIVVPVAGAVLLFLILTVNLPNMRAAHHLVYAVSPLPAGPTENLKHFRDALATGTFATQEIREQLVGYTSHLVTQPAVPDALKTEYVRLAIEEVEKEVSAVPLDVRARMQAALLYQSIGDYPRALAHIETARKVSEERQLIMFQQANIFALMDRRDEAAALLEKIYEISPRTDDVVVRVAAGFIAAGRSARGEEILADKFGTRVVEHDVLVGAYASAKQYDRVIEIVSLQIERAPDSPELRYRLATAYALAGRVGDARREVQAAMVRFPATRAQGEMMLASLSQAR